MTLPGIEPTNPGYHWVRYRALQERYIALQGREFRLDYVGVSSSSNSIANRFSSLSYVDYLSFSFQLTPDTHHPETVP